MSKKIIKSMILVIILLLISIKTNAATEYATYKVDITSKMINEGDLVTINVGINNVANEKEGVTGFSADIKFNTDEVEVVKIEAANENWQYQGYNASNGRFSLTSLEQEYGTTSGWIAKITVKVKKLEEGKNTNIQVTNISYSDKDYNDKTANGLSTSLYREGYSDQNNSNTNEINNEPNNTSSNTVENNIRNTGKNNISNTGKNNINVINRKDNTRYSGKIFNAGINYIIIELVVIFIIIGIIVFIHYKKIKNIIK